jgi:hypothetical protein
VTWLNSIKSRQSTYAATGYYFAIDCSQNRHYTHTHTYITAIGTSGQWLGTRQTIFLASRPPLFTKVETGLNCRPCGAPWWKKKTRSGLLGTELTGRPIQVAVMSAEQRVCASDTLIGWRINGPNVMTERTQVSWICLRPSAH